MNFGLIVVVVFIATSNLENLLPEKLEKLMFDITGTVPVFQRASHFADQI